jgi:hypothetical protein
MQLAKTALFASENAADVRKAPQATFSNELGFPT